MLVDRGEVHFRSSRVGAPQIHHLSLGMCDDFAVNKEASHPTCAISHLCHLCCVAEGVLCVLRGLSINASGTSSVLRGFIMKRGGRKASAPRSQRPSKGRQEEEAPLPRDRVDECAL